MYLAKRKGRDRIVSFSSAGDVDGADHRASKQRPDDQNLGPQAGHNGLRHRTILPITSPPLAKRRIAVRIGELLSVRQSLSPSCMRVGRANGEDWLRLGEAAAELGVSLNTLRRWSDSGKLTSTAAPAGTGVTGAVTSRRCCVPKIRRASSRPPRRSTRRPLRRAPASCAHPSSSWPGWPPGCGRERVQDLARRGRRRVHCLHCAQPVRRRPGRG